MTSLPSIASPEAQMASAIKDNLRQVMQRQTISVRELARRAAVKASFIYDILNGKSTNPSTVKLARVAACLGVSLSTLLDGQREARPALTVISPGGADAVAVPWLRFDAATQQPVADAAGALCFSRHWLEGLTPRIEALALFAVPDDAMEPTLLRGDVLLIDRLHPLPSPSGLFALYDGVQLMVRRVEPFRRGAAHYLHIGADNTRYRSDDLPMPEITLLGRVIWVSRMVG